MQPGAVKYIQQYPQVAIAQKYMALVRSFGAEFGLSPASRTRIHVDTKEQDPEVERIFGS